MDRIGSILTGSVRLASVCAVVRGAIVSVLVLVQNIHGIYWLLSSWILRPLQQQMYRCRCAVVRTAQTGRHSVVCAVASG